MASEIRVDKINSLSGVGTVTLSPTGVDISGITTVSTLKVGTGLTASSDGDVFFTGIATATTFSGSGASLTALPSAQLSGALPAISAASLTNVPAANVVGVHTSLTVTNATTTGTAVVGGGVTISESGIEASGIGITVASINGGSISGRRNLIINGAMQVAQRGTSSSSTDNFNTVDRIRNAYGTQDEIQTNSQVALSSGESPYTEGLRYYHRTQNGNQTSGAQAGSYVIRAYKIEAQDVAQSGWNYTNPNSFITLQFWVRSSVAQDYNFEVFTSDGTPQTYSFIFTLSANTWTKVIRTIPGNSNLQFDNNNAQGLSLNWYPYIGTTYTASDTTLDAWHQRTGTYRRTMTTTWFTTNDSTFDITGVQLEVGTQATAFENRTFAEELRGCQRYLFKNIFEAGENGCNYGKAYSSTELFASVRFPVAMRATPTIIAYSNSGTAGQVHKLGSPDTAYTSIDRLDAYGGMRINSSAGAWGTGDTDMYSFTFQADAEI